MLVTADDLRAASNLDAAPGPVLAEVAQAADTLLRTYLTPDRDDDPHEAHAHCRQAALAVAQQIWAGRVAPGGTLMGADLGAMVVPTLTGRALIERVAGLIGPCRDVGGFVG